MENSAVSEPSVLKIAIEVMHQIYDHLHSLAETKTRGSGKRLHRARAMFSIVAEEDIAASGVVRPAVTEGLAENELLSVELRSIQEIYTKDGWFIHNELWGKLFYELCALYERADIHHDIATAIYKDEQLPERSEDDPDLSEYFVGWEALHAEIRALQAKSQADVVSEGNKAIAQ